VFFAVRNGGTNRHRRGEGASSQRVVNILFFGFLGTACALNIAGQWESDLRECHTISLCHETFVAYLSGYSWELLDETIENGPMLPISSLATYEVVGRRQYG
jgi:hypothetical protein